jgi:hypothetical protein
VLRQIYGGSTLRDDLENGWIEDALHWACWQYNPEEGALAFIRDEAQWVYGVPLREVISPPRGSALARSAFRQELDDPVNPGGLRRRHQ